MIGNPVKNVEGKSEDGVKWWFTQIDRGLRLRKDEESQWEENEKFENMKQWDGEFGDIDHGSETTINKVGSWMQTHRAALAFKKPTVKLTPKNNDGWEKIPVPKLGPGGQPATDEMGQMIVGYIEKYKVRETLLNNILHAPLFGINKTISRLVKSGALGYGALKVGYRPKFETEYRDDPAEQEVKITPDGIDFVGSGYMTNPVTGEPILDDDDNLISRTAIPIWEDWFIDWVHYRHMVIDPDGGNDFMKHRWVAMEIIRPLEDVKHDDLLKNTKDLTGGGDLYDSEDYNDFRPGDIPTDYSNADEFGDKAKMVRLFEIWDLVNDKMIVLADGHGEYLRNEPVPRGCKYGPFVFYRPNEVIGKCEQFYPRPKVTDLAPLNKEYNKARRQQLIAMQKSNRKYLTKEGSLNRDALDALTNSEDMAIVNIKVDGSYGVGDSVAALASPPVNDALYANIAQISRDFDEVAGQPGESRGVASSKTATQVNNMSQYAGVRLDYDRTVLVDCLVEAIKKLDDSIEANMTIERSVQLMGSDGQAFVGIVDADMIAGDYEHEIDIEDMMPVDSAQQAALKAQFAQIAGQSPWLIADEELAIGWGKEFGIRDVNFLKALSKAAQMQMAMAMAPAQPKVPEAGPPQSEADAIAQTGAGMQAPAMQGANN
jgi:hypothetical protein